MLCNSIETSSSLGSLHKFEGAAGEFKGPIIALELCLNLLSETFILLTITLKLKLILQNI